MGNPSEKQIAVLKKNGKEIPATSQEASKIIGEIFDSQSKEFGGYKKTTYNKQTTQPVFDFKYNGSNGNDVDLLERFDRYQKLAHDLTKKQHPDLDVGSNVFGQIMNAIITHLIKLEN